MRKSSPLYQAVLILDSELSENFPIYAENKPLSLDTFDVLIELGYGSYGRVLHSCIARHCHRHNYLFNILSDSNRYSLATGEVSGVIDDKQKSHAVECLKRINKNRERREAK